MHINNVPLWPALRTPYLHRIHSAVNTMGNDGDLTLQGPFFQLAQTFCHMLAEVPLLFMFLLGRKKVSRLPTKQLLCSLSKKIFSYEMLIEVPRALVEVQNLNGPMVKTWEGRAGELGYNFCFLSAVNEYCLTFFFSSFPFGNQSRTPRPDTHYKGEVFKVLEAFRILAGRDERSKILFSIR